MLKKMCPNCRRVAINQNQNHCAACKDLVSEQRKDNNKTYDKYHRKSDIKTFYNSGDWQRVREIALSKYNYLDIYDYYVNKKISSATTVHHIVEIDDDWEQRLVLDNLLPLSDGNHNKIHGMYTHSRQATQIFLKSLVERWENEIASGQGG